MSLEIRHKTTGQRDNGPIMDQDHQHPHDPTDQPLSQTNSVPVFNCIVYVSPLTEGTVRARVANLAGIQCTAASEREALTNIVQVFKQHVTDLIGKGESISWIEPTPPARNDELERFIPVHL